MGCMIEAVFYGNISFILATYAINIQYAAHAAIGLNRFLVFSDVRLVTDIRTKVPAIVTSLDMDQTNRANNGGRRPSRLLAHGCLEGCRPYKTGGNEHARRLLDGARDPMGTLWPHLPLHICFQITPASQVLNNSVMSVVSIGFELRALALYRKLTATARHRYHNDFLLLSKDLEIVERKAGNESHLTWCLNETYRLPLQILTDEGWCPFVIRSLDACNAATIFYYFFQFTRYCSFLFNLPVRSFSDSSLWAR